MARGNETNPAPPGPSPCHARPAGRALIIIILNHGIEHVVYLAFVCVTALHCLQLPARPGIVTAISLLRYVKVISKPSDASSSSSGSHAEGSSTDRDGQCHGARVDDSAEDLGPSPLKRAKTVSHTLDSKLSASEVDAILTAEVPDLGLFPIVNVRNSAATHDRIKEKLLKSRFVPSKCSVAPKRQCGQKKRCVSDDFFNQELYPCVCYSVSKDALYCIVCILFGLQSVMLTTAPLTDWSNARRLICKHENTSDHKFAQEKSVNFLRVCDKEQLGIAQHMTKAQYELMQHNTKVLHAIISLIATCRKQNVLLRGKTDDRSNFMAFLHIVLRLTPICNNI